MLKPKREGYVVADIETELEVKPPTPYGDAFIDFRDALSGLMASLVASGITPANRDQVHRATVDVLTRYNQILTKLQEHGIPPTPTPEPVRIDGRDFNSPLDAALHLLWLLQRLSRYDEGHVGEPCDGFRFREGIVESRKLLKLMGKDVE